MRAIATCTDCYALLDPLSDRKFRAAISGELDQYLVLRGETTIIEPVEASWTVGADRPADVIWTTTLGVVLIGERVLDIFQRSGFTGWSTYPALVTGAHGEEITGYFGLSIVGRCGARDYSQSEVVFRRFPGGLFPHFRGQFFEPGSWDGSDLFMERPDARGEKTTFVYVTTRVKQALDGAKIENLEFQALADMETDVQGVRIGSPHRLPPDIDSRIEQARAQITD